MTNLICCKTQELNEKLSFLNEESDFYINASCRHPIQYFAFGLDQKID